MASRTAYWGTEGAADVVTTTNFNKLPGGELAYGKWIANTPHATGTQTVVTVPVTVGTSRTLMIYAGCSGVWGTGNPVLLAIYDATAGAIIAETTAVTVAGSLNYAGNEIVAMTQPAAGLRSYALQVITTGTDTAGVNASSTSPAYLFIDDAGPAF